jgi:hypothetical protein
VGENFLEGTVSEVGERAGGTGVAEEAFGGHDDEGFDDFAKGLTSEEVKVVGGSGGVGNGHIVFGAELKKSFDAGAGVFGSLAVVAVREEESKARGGAPFRFGGADVLIDLGLGAVGEIAKLSFPEDEHIWAVEGVTVIEAENGGFGEGAIVNAERGLIFREVFEGNIAGAGAKVVDGGVPMAERAAAAVLA